jgi:thiamine biosynthesis lipoprotein
VVGHQSIVINQEDGTIELRKAGMRLDLGGIGKGFAADRAIDTLRGEGITSCLVDLGGDIALADPPPGRPGWLVKVQHGDGTNLALELANAGVATSGDTVQFVEIDGVRYSHILDPATCVGLTNRTAVTVIAPTGTQADALASAVSVLGQDAGLELIETLPATECLISVAGLEGPSQTASSGFPIHPSEIEPP